jgi:hypothetical protein
MDEWKYASEIDELKPFFTLDPPIIKQTENPEEMNEIIPIPSSLTQKSHFILAILFVLIMIFVLVLNIIQNKKKHIRRKK